MEDCAKGRPSSPRHCRASEVAAREERFCSNPQGLLVQEMDGQRKLVIPQSLRQKVLASYHDEPTKNHARFHRIEELTNNITNGKAWAKTFKNMCDTVPYIR